MNTPRKTSRQSGFSMVEVLVTLIILLTGLLGLAGLMMQSQRSEMESYQRVQALILLQDMEGRINANRKGAVCYGFTPAAGTQFLGTSTAANPAWVPAPLAACTAANITTIYPSLANFPGSAQNAVNTAISDLTAWNLALQGAAESVAGAGTAVGAMVGARGCIFYDPTTELPDVNTVPIPGSGVFTLAVAWQGLAPTFAPANTCGINLYGATDAQRRVVTLTMRMANLK